MMVMKIGMAMVITRPFFLLILGHFLSAACRDGPIAPAHKYLQIIGLGSERDQRQIEFMRIAHNVHSPAAGTRDNKNCHRCQSHLQKIYPRKTFYSAAEKLLNLVLSLHWICLVLWRNQMDAHLPINRLPPSALASENTMSKLFRPPYNFSVRNKGRE